MKLQCGLITLACAYWGHADLSINEKIIVEGDSEGRQLQIDVSKSLLPVADASPAFTFYVPFTEPQLYETFQAIGNASVAGDMISMISVAISTNQTVIWYDHWEDGMEKSIDDPDEILNTTEIWGDGDASNGCRPDIVDCQDEDDMLNAGDSFVLESKVPFPRGVADANETEILYAIFYDGGDKIASSYPIAINRGAYAEKPGSKLAGATEVFHDAAQVWGNKFEVPVGPTFETETNAFAVTRLFITAKDDGTVVTLPDGSTEHLDEGECAAFDVNQGDIFASSRNTQAHLVTGAASVSEANYQMRWFSLLPNYRISTKYHAAFGDTVSNTKLLIYNPNDSATTVDIHTKDASTDGKGIEVGPNQAVYSGVIPSGSGATVEATKKIYVLSVSDTEVATESSTGELVKTFGEAYAWGYTVVPSSMLESQIFVGWGYGCNEKDCLEKSGHAGVFVSAESDADFWIDTDNSGIVENYVSVSGAALESVKLEDKGDTDLSAARVWAVKQGSGPNGPGVVFNAAWGQDASVSRDSEYHFDLGTAIVPFPKGEGSGKAVKGNPRAGKTLTYSITISNTGTRTFSPGDFIVHDILPEKGITYVEGSTAYSQDSGQTYTTLDSDTTGATAFQIDETGLKSQGDLVGHGGAHVIRYQLKIDDPILDVVELVNYARVEFPDDPSLNQEWTRKRSLRFDQKISISNTVYLGDNGEEGCADAVEKIEEFEHTHKGEKVTYCFTVTNSGATYLGNVTFHNSELGIEADVFEIPDMLPGDSKLITFSTTMDESLRNKAVARGNPTFNNWNDIWTLNDVTATDYSEVALLKTATPTKAPSPAPTRSPSTEAPTNSPAKAPVSGPPTETRAGNTGGGGGDPHFKTWTGKKFDYHGECDLVLLDHPMFADGKGLRVHIRTTRIQYYSYISSIAIQIGTDVLEFANNVDEWLLNGQKRPEIHSFLSGYQVRRFIPYLSLQLDNSVRAKIDLMKRKNGMPYVVVDGGNSTMFQGSLGLLGEWSTGEMVGRDGTTVMQDAEEYALEWQVRDTEPMLFQTARAPQFPTVCTPPKKMMGSRLGDSHMKKAAEKMCAAWKEDKEECIFDVMATRDISNMEESPMAVELEIDAADASVATY